MLYYLDSSAWVKRYFDEAGSGRVRHLFAWRRP
jgi:predicted nucleic acid-binding protein